MTQKNFKYPFKTSDLPYTETFTRPDGSVPSGLLWEQEALPDTNIKTEITGGEYKVSTVNTISTNGTTHLNSRFELVGDFDVSLKYDQSVPNINYQLCGIRVYNGEGAAMSFATVYAEYYGGIKKFVNIGSLNGSNVYGPNYNNGRINESGTVRITRVGTTISFFTGDGLATATTPFGSFSYNDLAVKISFKFNFPVGTTAGHFFSADDITVNSADGINWPYIFMDDFDNYVLLENQQFIGNNGDTAGSFINYEEIPTGTGAISTIQNNSLNITSAGGLSGGWMSSFQLVGDYDIELELTQIDYSGGAGLLGIGTGANEIRETKMRALGANWDLNGATTPRNFDFGFVRLKRTGSSINSYYKDFVGDAWILADTTTYNSDPHNIFISAWSDTGILLDSIVDNLVVNSADGMLGYKEAPTENWWSASADGELMIIDNKLVMYPQIVKTSTNAIAKFKLSGDFEIECKFSDVNLLSNSGDWCGMMCTSEAGDYLYTTRRNSGLIGGVYGGGATSFWSGNADYGRMKIKRTGDYWVLSVADGDGAYQTTIAETHIWDGLVTVNLRCTQQTSTPYGCSFDNFNILSADKIVWPGGTLKRWNGSAWVPTVMNQWNGVDAWEDRISKNYVTSNWEYVGNV